MILGCQGLLQDRDPELIENRQHANRLLHGPAAVGVDPDLLVCRVSNSGQDLHVAFGPQLDLENGIVFRLAHLGPDLLDSSQSNGEGRFRCGAGIEAPQPVHRRVESFADQIVQGRRERGSGGGVTPQLGGPALLGPLQEEGVVRQHGPIHLERRQNRVRGFPVVFARSGLAPTLDSFGIGEPHPDGAMVALPTPGDDERVPGAQLQDFNIHSQVGSHSRSSVM
jgi:hypothetical protein